MSATLFLVIVLGGAALALATTAVLARPTDRRATLPTTDRSVLERQRLLAERLPAARSHRVLLPVGSAASGQQAAERLWSTDDTPKAA